MGTHMYVFQQLTTEQSENLRFVCNSRWWEELKLEHKSGASAYLDVFLGCRMSKITMDCPAGPLIMVIDLIVQI